MSRSIFDFRLLTFLFLLPVPALAQRSQWTDMVYVPGRWQGAQLAPLLTRNQRTDTLALVMRVDYFANPPRWRAEVRRSVDGQALGQADIILGNGAAAQVVTRLGATPLDRHVLGRDSLVRALVRVMNAGGRRTGVSSGRFAEQRADGSLLRVGFRRSQRTAQFDDRLLDPRNSSAGAQLIGGRLASVGDQRSAGVVATAGARGVDRVRTPGGEIAVTPDTLAVLRMERFAVGMLRLEDFMRLGGLGPYRSDNPAVEPPPAPPRDSALRIPLPPESLKVKP